MAIYFFRLKRFIILLQAVIVVFVATVGILMLFFPRKEGHPGGYRFFYEFVSALGMTKTKEGVDNLSGALVFNSVLGGSMLMLIPFWYYRIQCLNTAFLLKVFTMICFTGFSLGICGVALLPYNLLPKAHDISVYSAFMLIIPGMIILTIFTEHNFYVGKTKIVMLLSFALILFGELVIQIMVSKRIIASRPAFPVLQKINISVFLVWLFNELNSYHKFISVEEVK